MKAIQRLHTGLMLCGVGLASATPLGAVAGRGVGALLGLAGYRYGYHLNMT